MTEKLFVRVINNLKKQRDKDRENAQHLNKVFENAFEANLFPNNYLLEETVIELLSESVGDRGGWIEHFIYELDFGKNYVEPCVWRKDGSVIDLSSAAKLYKFLNE